MFQHSARLFRYSFFALAALVWTAQSLAAEKFYDVSYVWSRDIAAVEKYRDQVARILGPVVARDLRVVSDGGLHGVVYLRRGDSAGAARVARAHSRLLEAQGLDTAAPVVSRDWGLATEAPDRLVSAPPPEPEKPAASPSVEAQADTPKAAPPPLAQSAPKQRAHDLEAAVEAYIKGLRKKGKISDDERTGWSVYDFTTGEKLVTINEEAQFQAASLIKPFIAAAFFQQVKKGELHYGPRSRRQMERMIQQSNNWATNWVMRQAGGPRAVQRILKRHYPGIFRSTRIVEYIPAGGKTYRNKASARDYSRFLYAIWKDRIAGAREIRRLMSLPGPDRIYTGAEDVPAGTRVLNKTGSTARLCADMGILNVKGPDGRRYPYTLIGIIEKQNKARNYTSCIRSRSEVIRDVSNIIYRGIAERHDFADVM